MTTRDNEINFYAEVTPEEFENEFLEKEKLFRLLAEQTDDELTEVEKELTLNTTTTTN